jgi:glutathionylspermidine synthase
MEKTSYEENRERLYAPLRAEGTFTWDSMYGQEYALATVHPIASSFRREIAEATEKLGAIFARTVQVVQHASDDLLMELGIPREAWDSVRFPVAEHLPTLIGRFDFAKTSDGLKMLEFNSDTPTGIVEAFYVNGRVCEYFGLENPNRGMDRHLTEAFRECLKAYRDLGFSVERIAFSALDWHEEDAGTTRYLLRQSGLNAQFVPLASLSVRGNSLYASLPGEGYQPIDVLYRLHAIEILAKDTDDDGYPTGAHLLSLIPKRKLALLNPARALLSQTKALQALIWYLYETGTFFEEEERETIARYMLPTYLENRFHGKSAYVRKPIFGREGGAVSLYDRSGKLIARDKEGLYWDQPMVYQQWAELEPIEVETQTGEFRGKLLWGSFMVNGKASAILARVDHKITSNLSYFLPVGLE